MWQFIIWLILTLVFTGLTTISGLRMTDAWNKWHSKEEKSSRDIHQTPVFDFIIEEKKETYSLDQGKAIPLKVAEFLKVHSLTPEVRLDKVTIDLPDEFFERRPDGDGIMIRSPLWFNDENEFLPPDHKLRVEPLLGILKSYFEKRRKIEIGSMEIKYGLKIPVAIFFRYTHKGKPNFLTSIYIIEANLIKYNVSKGDAIKYGIQINRIFLEKNNLQSRQQAREELSRLFKEKEKNWNLNE